MEETLKLCDFNGNELKFFEEIIQHTFNIKIESDIPIFC